MFGLGIAHYLKGEYAATRTEYTEALRLFRKSGKAWGIYATAMNLGCALYYLGEFSQAKRLHQEALVYYRDADNLEGIAWALERLALTEAQVGSEVRAARLLAAAEVVRDVWGNKYETPPDPRALDQATVRLQARLSQDAFEAARAYGRALTTEEAIALALEETR